MIGENRALIGGIRMEESNWQSLSSETSVRCSTVRLLLDPGRLDQFQRWRRYPVLISASISAGDNGAASTPILRRPSRVAVIGQHPGAGGVNTSRRYRAGVFAGMKTPIQIALSGH